MSELSPYREVVLIALKKKISKKNAEIFEKRIYEMCVRLSEEYEDELEDLYRIFAYEKVGCIFFAKTNNKRKQILQDIKNNTLEWEESVYDEYRARRDEQNTSAVTKEKTEKGTYRCKNRKCGSDDCEIFQQQTRSADEGFTTFVSCRKCGNRYKFN